MRECPKCSFRSVSEVECPRCGIIYDRWQPRTPAFENPLPLPVDPDRVENGTIGSSEIRILAAGAVLAVLAYAFPLTRFILSAMVTLFHEFGHAVAGWLLGHPSLPAFDFVYGGGFTHQGQFRPLIAAAIGGGLAWLVWHFRQNRKGAALFALVLVIWLIAVSASWRRELVIAAAGHAFEFILAGILFYQALSGVGWRHPEVERPLGAFVAFFVQIHSMLFAWRLIRDPEFLAWYREGKGGALMNDLEVVALDLTIRFGLEPGIEGVAKMLLVFSLVPIGVGIAWFLQRARWHELLRSLRTIES